jgi:NTE family protein
LNNKRKRIGLALGGGVARGMAHIGVLTVLEREGIPIDFIAGTSAGSLIGALYCAGRSAAEIKAHTIKLNWLTFASPVWPSRGLVSFERLERWLVNELGDITFADLKIPFAAVAADLDTGFPVRLSSGRLAPAVRASCSVPGFVTPLEIDGRLLGDGSLADTVPVDILREMGADYVIGVDIFTSSIRPRWGPFGMGFTAMEILVQRAGGGIDTADCLISPRLGGETYLRFSKRERLFKLGEEAAEEKLPFILQALS